MPRRFRIVKKFGRRSHAATTIGQAWRRRARRKTSLVARTVKSNRNQIKRINRSIESKMIDNVLATIGNRYGGQILQSIGVQIDGTDPTGVALVIRPFSGMGNGDLINQREGAKIRMKSLTYKIQFNAAIAESNKCGCFIVLDKSPTNNPPTLSTGLADGVILNGVSPLQYLRYQNMDTCAGTEARFKVLRHIKCSVSGVVGSQWPINAIRTGTLKYPYNIRYNQAAGSVEPTNQQLLFCFYSDSSVLPHPLVQMYTRLRYKDA